MKHLSYIFFAFILVSGSGCLKSGLDDLPLFENAEIIDFDFEYRFISQNQNGFDILQAIQLPTNVSIDTLANSIVASVSIPSPNSIFTQAERRNVTLSNLVGFASISTAATIEPMGSSPLLGVPGDFSSTNEYKVTAANGTERVWSIQVNPLPVINQYEGLYQETGTLVRGSNPPDNLEAQLYLSSLNDNTLIAQAGKSIFNNPGILYQIQINGDNSVTIKSDPNSVVAITPTDGKISTYNPSTKTFDLHYNYFNSSGTPRAFDTTLKLIE